MQCGQPSFRSRLKSPRLEASKLGLAAYFSSRLAFSRSTSKSPSNPASSKRISSSIPRAGRRDSRPSFLPGFEFGAPSARRDGDPDRGENSLRWRIKSPGTQWRAPWLTSLPTACFGDSVRLWTEIASPLRLQGPLPTPRAGGAPGESPPRTRRAPGTRGSRLDRATPLVRAIPSSNRDRTEMLDCSSQVLEPRHAFTPRLPCP